MEVNFSYFKFLRKYFGNIKVLGHKKTTFFLLYKVFFDVESEYGIRFFFFFLRSELVSKI